MWAIYEADTFGDANLGRSIWGDQSGEVNLGRSTWGDQSGEISIGRWARRNVVIPSL
jgi:hypothetical protein